MKRKYKKLIAHKKWQHNEHLSGIEKQKKTYFEQQNKPKSLKLKYFFNYFLKCLVFLFFSNFSIILTG